jgi:hypothetical protein
MCVTAVSLLQCIIQRLECCCMHTHVAAAVSLLRCALCCCRATRRGKQGYLCHHCLTAARLASPSRRQGSQLYAPVCGAASATLWPTSPQSHLIHLLPLLSPLTVRLLRHCGHPTLPRLHARVHARKAASVLRHAQLQDVGRPGSSQRHARAQWWWRRRRWCGARQRPPAQQRWRSCAQQWWREGQRQRRQRRQSSRGLQTTGCPRVLDMFCV